MFIYIYRTILYDIQWCIRMSDDKSEPMEEYSRWSKEVKRGATTLAILAVLHQRPAYGYEIVQELESRMSFLSLEQGTVYPILRRLNQRKILQSEWKYSDPAKPKKYYSLTYDGKSALDMMMET